MPDQIDIDIHFEDADRVAGKLDRLPTELRAVLSAATEAGTGAMLTQEEATVPRRTGREQSLTRSTFSRYGDDIYVGTVFTEARYARYPEAGTIYQRAQRTFRTALQMEIAPFVTGIDTGVETALKL